MKNKIIKSTLDILLEAEEENNTQGMSGGDSPTEADSNMNNPSDDTNPENTNNNDKEGEFIV